MSENKLNLKNISTVKDLIKQINFDDYFYFSDDEQINLRQVAYNITKRATLINNIATHTAIEIDALSCLINSASILICALCVDNKVYPSSNENPEVIIELKELLHSLVDDIFVDAKLEVCEKTGQVTFHVDNKVFGITSDDKISPFQK